MAFSVKDWKDYPPETSTPISAAALEDLETRVTDYTDDLAAVGGRELAYAEITSAATRGTSTYADVAGLSISPTIGSRPVQIKFHAGLVYNTSAGGGVQCQIVDSTGGGTVEAGAFYSAAASGYSTMTLEARDAPAAGARTYKVQFHNNGSGTANIYASAIQPAFIQAVEL